MATRLFTRVPLMALLALLVAAGVLAACGDTPTATPGATAPTAAATAAATTGTTGGAAEVAVTLKEWAVEPAAIATTAGKQKFTVKNAGKFPHNFTVMVGDKAMKTANMEAGGTAVLETELAAGTYQTLCDIPGHPDQGMKGTLVVK
jgi:uncharacterized cupredoxin-like copper-binding protein